MASKKYETYYMDHINSIRSFMVDQCAHTPVPLTPAIEDSLKKKFGDNDQDMLLLQNYVLALQLINYFGYHTHIPEMMDRFFELSQESRIIAFENKEVKRYLRGEVK